MTEETQDYHEVEEVKENPVSVVIEQALQKHNVTDAIINNLKERYGSLVINGQEDREGYRAVKEARIECKNWRVLAKKITTKGREEALQVQKAWVAKEKEIVARIGEVEDYLQEQEDGYNAERDRIKREEKEKQEQRTMQRTAQLNKLGAQYDGVNFVLDGATVEGVIVREVDDEMYNKDVLPKFQEMFEQREKVRIEKEEEERKEKLRMEQERRELEERREKERREQEEKERAEKEAAEKLYDSRVEQLSEMQFVFVKKENRFKSFHVMIDDASVKNSTAEEWNSFIEMAATEISKAKADAAEKEMEEQKERAEAERLKVLGTIRQTELKAFLPDSIDVIPEEAAKWSEEEYQENLSNAKYQHDKRQRQKFEQEAREKKEREEKERQEQEDKKSDTAKWNEYIAHLLSKPVPEFRGTFYRKKGIALRNIVDQIKNL